MGFWKQLFGFETCNGHKPPGPRLDPPTRPAPHSSEKPMPEIKEPKKDIPVKDISEPVLSIIRSLKDGEWSFVGHPYNNDIVYFTHEWFGHKLVVLNISMYVTVPHPVCQSEWMTQDEKEAVGDVCWQIYQERAELEKEQAIIKQRQSFMNLTEEYYHGTENA